MIQTRGQFGSFGALLVVGLVVVMYVGFFASNCVFGGQALHSLNAGIPLDAGVVVIGLISLLGSIYGYKLIHAYARLLSWCSGSVLVLAFVWIIFVHGLPADTFSKHSLNLSGFLGAMSVAACGRSPMRLTYRTIRATCRPIPPRTAFWSSYWGCVLGSFFPMLLGCLVGLATPDGNVVSGLTGLTRDQRARDRRAVVRHRGQQCDGTVLRRAVGHHRAADAPSIVVGQGAGAGDHRDRPGIALAIALFGQDNFLAGYTNFILLLLYVLVPWTAINLVDYYLVCHGEYDVDSFFRQDGGIYGRFNTIAVGSYFIGIVAQAPFMATDLYTGELASRLGGADVSWIVGLSLTSLVYYAGASCSRGRCRASRERFVSAGHSVLTNARRIIRSRPRLSADARPAGTHPAARPFPECAMKRARLGEAEPARSPRRRAHARSSDWASAPRSSS